MGRDGELTEQFRDMMTALRREIEGEVAGEWYLFKKGDLPPFITYVEEGFVANGTLTVEWHRKYGWTVIPVSIFRKRLEK